jgi:hypothetical protein
MLFTYIITILIILVLMVGWIAVQHLSRWFAARHPEFGAAREEGGGCGGLFCFCKDKLTCPKQSLKRAIKKNPQE